MSIIWLIVVIVCSVVSVNAEKISISIGNTKINGRIKSFNGTKVGVFYGIPYAKPPIGQLRFKEPKPIKRWPEVINALELPVACVQISNPLLAYSNLGRNGTTSEDCLYLNIWTPISNQNKLKTVMVYIHAGDNFYGSSNQPFYESTVLSAIGDVVVVSFNYRLGIFGFLYTGTDIGPGNVGLRDQISVLKWVKNNIRYFGGDPNKITVFGQSAGSFDTSALMLSPASRHLFRRAIMMSGAALGLNNIFDRQNVLTYWNSFAELVNCTDNGFNVTNSLSPIVIECLKNTPADQLINISLNPFLVPYFVSDGVILTDNTLNMIEQGNFNNDLEILIGNTDNEGTIFLPFVVSPILFSPTNPLNITLNEAINITKQVISLIPTDKSINLDDMIKLYFTGLSEQSDQNILRQTIGLVIGDFTSTCPDVLFARALFEKSKQKIKVYEYVFNSNLGTGFLDCSDWMGVCHGQDIIPVFGYPFTQLNTSLDRAKQLSIRMIKIFTHFAKTGKTTAQNGAEWYSFYQINDITIGPYYEITNDEKTSTVKTGYKLNECLNLWKYYY